jgi:hypothetical protein
MGWTAFYQRATLLGLATINSGVLDGEMALPGSDSVTDSHEQPPCPSHCRTSTIPLAYPPAIIQLIQTISHTTPTIPYLSCLPLHSDRPKEPNVAAQLNSCPTLL